MSDPTFRLVKNSDGTRELRISHYCRKYLDGPTEVSLPVSDTDGWQVVHESPLTVRPSIHCLECGLHGFLTDGMWVDA